MQRGNKSYPSSKRIRKTYVPSNNFTGNKFTPHTNPPDIVLQPFNHLTLVHSGSDQTGFYEFTISDISKLILKQIDPSSRAIKKDDPMVQFKLQSVKAWAVTGKTLAFTVFDFSAKLNSQADSNTTQLVGTMDVAGHNSYAAVGYHLPIMHQSIVLGNTEIKDRKILAISVGPGNTALIYIRLLWKFTGPVKGPTISADILHKILKNNTTSLRTLNSTLLSNNTKLQELIATQPGLVTRTIDNVKKLASIVVPIGFKDEESNPRSEEIEDLVTQVKELLIYFDESNFEKVDVSS